MICRPCRDQRHKECVDVHLFNSGRQGCSCQHRTGGFSTAVLAADGSKTDGVHGATGARGSALYEPLPPILGPKEESTVDKILKEMGHG